MTARLMTYITSKSRGLLSILLSLVVISSSGCLKNKVAEASRRKAEELIAKAQTEKSASSAEATPSVEAESQSVARTSQSISDAPSDDKQPDSPGAAKEKRLYIDASKSMAGFAGHGGDFDKFFSEIGYLLGDPVVYKFGSAAKTPAPKYAELIEPTTLGQAQKSSQFYNLSNNPDDALFSELNHSGKEALSVYITDGVYSAMDAKAGSKVITPLTQWLESGRVLGIFVLSSPFQGSFYSEKLCSESKGQKCWLQVANVPRRPFYAFVFSPNEDAFRKLQRELENKFPSMKTLIFSDDGVTSEGLSLPEDDSIYDSSKQAEGFNWQMFTSHLFTEENPAKRSFYLNYVVNKEYPLGHITPLISAKYYLWDNARSEFIDGDLHSSFKSVLVKNPPDQTLSIAPVSGQDSLISRSNWPRVDNAAFINVSLQEGLSTKQATPTTKSTRAQDRLQPKRKESANPATKKEVQSQDGANSLASAAPASDEAKEQSVGFELQIPRDTRSSYGFYYLQINIEVDTVNPGIEELSTDDDSDPLQANRTYRFAEVVKALLEAHLQGRLAAHVAPPLFLTISN
jgi:hypothetical protein